MKTWAVVVSAAAPLLGAGVAAVFFTNGALFANVVSVVLLVVETVEFRRR